MAAVCSDRDRTRDNAGAAKDTLFTATSPKPVPESTVLLTKSLPFLTVVSPP
jgi:hypothetical protein